MIEPDGIKLGNGLICKKQGDTATLSIDRDYLRSIVLQNAVYSINGQHAAPDGSFFIHGSECDSWSEVRGGTVTETGDEDSATYRNGELQVVVQDGLALTDLCPTCSSCETLYRIKKELEYFEMFVNMMKDVMLHNSTDLLTDKAALNVLRVIGSTVHCTDDPDYSDLDPMKGMQLLQQYITVAHMWNYAVMQNNASFRMEIAPEDTAGFVVQTKRALPSCDGTWRIRCTIKIEYDHRQNDDNSISSAKQDLSVFVPEPVLWFKPFNMEDPDEPIIGTNPVEYVSAEDAALQTLVDQGAGGSTSVQVLTDAKVHVTHDNNCTTKTIQTDFIQARVSGTYGLQMKFLPFVNFVMYDAQNHVITVRGATVNISGKTIGDNVYYDFAPDHTSRQPIVAPTKDDYLNAKTAPTSSVPFNNVWRVEILWEVGKPERYTEEDSIHFQEIMTTTSAEPGNEVPEITTLVPGTTTFEEALAGYDVPFESETFFEYKETRLYTTTGAREPNNQAIITGSTIPVDIPISTASSNSINQ